MTALLVAVGAGVGAMLRFLAGHFFDDERFPAGTLVVNVAGSFMLGAFSAMLLPPAALAVLGAGLAGGLTTYSAFAVQTHRLGPARGSLYAALTVALSLVACAAGHALYA